jgi:hypothetical protein
MKYEFNFTTHARERYVERVLQVRKKDRATYLEKNQRKIDGLIIKSLSKAKIIDTSSLSVKVQLYFTKRYKHGNTFYINGKDIYIVDIRNNKKVLVTVFKNNGDIGKMLNSY